MPPPERRTRADLVATACITAVVTLVTAVLWWTSDARGTAVRTAAVPLPSAAPAAPDAVPAELNEGWRAHSPATPVPAVAGAAVITGDGGEVTGRDPVTGEVRWAYRRDLGLCTVGVAFGRALALHRDGDACSQVTALESETGERADQRTGPLGRVTRLIADPTHVTAVGARYLETWRTDLVRTLRYGALPSPVKPGAQPRTRCTFGSVAMFSGLLGVVERCPGEDSDRLTVQRSAPAEPDQPEITFSTLLPGRDAVVVALTRDRTAVALPDPAGLVVLDEAGRLVARHPLPAAERGGDPPGRVAVTTAGAGLVCWFTGSATVALDAETLAPRWQVPGTLGPGSLLADRLLVPVPDGLAVLDTATGDRVGLLPVDRGAYQGPVATAIVGDVVLEQRADSLVALRAP